MKIKSFNYYFYQIFLDRELKKRPPLTKICLSQYSIENSTNFCISNEFHLFCRFQTITNTKLWLNSVFIKLSHMKMRHFLSIFTVSPSKHKNFKKSCYILNNHKKLCKNTFFRMSPPLTKNCLSQYSNENSTNFCISNEFHLFCRFQTITKLWVMRKVDIFYLYLQRVILNIKKSYYIINNHIWILNEPS